MLRISIDFGDPINLAGFLVLAAANVAWVWLLARNDRVQWIVWSFVLLNLLAALLWCFSAAIDEDEAELLHTTWMLTQGMTPYVDFWQHHLPLGWVLLAPLVKLIAPSPTVYVFARLIATAMTILIYWLTWQIARSIWKEQADPASFSLLFLSGVGYWQFAWIRVDLPMIVFLLAGVWSALRIAEGRRSAAFWSGLFIALGLSFSLKQCWIVLLPVAVMMLDGHRDHGRRLSIYVAGGALGALPLALFVLHYHVTAEFIYWVVRFNSSKTVVLSLFPAALAFVAGFGIWLLVRRHREAPDIGHIAILIAFFLATWASMFSTGQAFSYYMNYWMVLAAVLGAGIALPRFLPSAQSSALRISLVAVLLVLLTLPNAKSARSVLRAPFWRELRDMQTLLDVADQRPVMMFNPQHPVFVADATRLYTRWQFLFVRGPEDRNVIEAEGSPGFVESILKNRPAIIAATAPREQDLLTALQAKGIVDAKEAARRQALLDESYVLRRIGESEYFVARDRAEFVPAPPTF